MSVFHQIGDRSINLVKEENLNQFKGMVCSPLNYSECEVIANNKSLPPSFCTILDPHMYFPKSERGKLHSWSYFPNDFDSTDQSSKKWWEEINIKLIDTCNRTGCSHVCSPCVIPSRFTSEYYKFYVEIGNDLFNRVKKAKVGFYQTAIIDYNSIKEEGEPEVIASILSQTEGSAIYLIIYSNIEPRRELCDSDSLTGIMRLIHLLSDSALDVFVAFCSSEFVLWKYAGAKDFATGKFFNLRRFTSSRFEEPSGGGGQLPYWFEKNLMAYLREGDLVRLKKENKLNPDYQKNPYSVKILEQLENSPGSAWLAASWKNYLYEFFALEATFDKEAMANDLLIRAEKNWSLLDDENILMEEYKNDGSWIRKWRIAISNYNKSI